MVDPRFGALLRELRQERGLSLRGLAKLALSSKSHLHDFETGLKQPMLHTARRLDEVLRAGGELIRLSAAREMARREFVGAAVSAAVALPAVPAPRAGRQVGGVDVTRLHHRTARLRRLDDYLGGADTYDIYNAELTATVSLANEASYPAAVGRVLRGVIAEQAQMTGWAAFDAGRHADAERLYRMSLDAATDATDRSLAANALAFLAYQLLSRGRSGVEVATASCDLAGSQAPGRVRALLHQRCAWACAVAGDADRAEAHLDLAASALQDRDAAPDWVFWVDDLEQQIMTGRCWAVLHKPVRTISVLERALGAYDDTHARDKALYLGWLADSYLDANEVEQACATTVRAIDLSYRVGSSRPRQRIGAVVRRTRQHTSTPGVAELRDYFAEWVRDERRSSAQSTPDKGSNLPPAAGP